MKCFAVVSSSSWLILVKFRWRKMIVLSGVGGAGEIGEKKNEVCLYVQSWKNIFNQVAKSLVQAVLKSYQTRYQLLMFAKICCLEKEINHLLALKLWTHVKKFCRKSCFQSVLLEKWCWTRPAVSWVNVMAPLFLCTSALRRSVSTYSVDFEKGVCSACWTKTKWLLLLVLLLSVYHFLSALLYPQITRNWSGRRGSVACWNIRT